MHRRTMLTIIAAAPVLAALPACSTATDAAEPWRRAGEAETDPRRRALSFAILAPNPHNMQPWLARLDGADTITLFIDDTRLLPHTDPFGRQIVMGCGAFIETLALAAAADGHRCDITLWPDGEPGASLDRRAFARVRLTRDPGVAQDPLARHLLARRTNRGSLDQTRPVSEAAMAAMRAAATASGAMRFGQTSAQTLAAFRKLAADAMVLEIRTPHTFQESIDVMRFGPAEAAAKPWGIVLDVPMAGLLKRVGILTPETLADTKSGSFKQGLDMQRAGAMAAMGFVWLAGVDNSRHTQIEAGRSYARLNLAATRFGVAMQPWSQALQEYPEMADLFVLAQSMTGASAEAPLQMLARVGYGRDVPPAPRRAMQSLMVT